MPDSLGVNTRFAPRATRPGPRSGLAQLALGFVLLSLVALVVVPLVVQRRVDMLRDTVEQVAEPARTLVTRLQFTLSRQMSSLRGFLLTGEDRYLEVYNAARDIELAAYEELEPLAVRLGPEALAGFVEVRTLSEQWHVRASDEEVVRLRGASPRFLAQIPVELELFEQTMAAASGLDSAIVRAASDSRGRIRSAERRGFLLACLLALVAVVAASVVGLLYRRSQRYATEAEIRRLQAEHALQEAAEAQEARVRLLRGVTHDVKNPLGAANGYADILEMGIKGPLAPGQAAMVAGIRRSIGSALSIITDLLDVARADNEGLPVSRKPTDLARVVAESVEDHRAAAEAAGHTLLFDEVSGPFEVHTDAVRVQQVLGNLISNAIKYAPAPGRIAVRTRLVDDGGAPRPGVWAAVRVEDSGPGIPLEQREAIFDEFTRLHDGTATEGHGLGLAIARRIARLLGGDLTVAGEPGQGAAFTLWLPCRAGDGIQQQEAAERRPIQQQRRHLSAQ